MKNTLVALLGFILLSTPLAATAQFNYTINNDRTITITGINGPGGAVVIPATINGLPVIRIGDYAFYNKSSLTSVTIPSSVMSIGYQALAGCTSLSAITVDVLNSRYSSVDGVLFSKGQALLIEYPGGKAGSYAIPDSVTWIGNQAFEYCTSLTSVTIPGSVTGIGDNAFRSCTSLTNVTIGNGVTSIGQWFSGCTSLTSITIGNGVTSIGNNAFIGCTSLSAIMVDASNSSFSSMDGVVFNKSQNVLVLFPAGKAGSYTIPDSVISIAGSAFYFCTGLTNVTIGNSITSIGDSAFGGCTSLTNVTMPNSVTTIGESAFAGCASLTSVTIPNNVTNMGGYAFASCASLASVTIGNSVTSIGSYAFYYCTNLTSITIPSSVSSIGSAAFLSCMGLTSIIIPASVTSFGNGNIGAFAGCTGLTNITILNSIIGLGMFDHCTNLTSITIPDSVTDIGGYAFYNCTRLTNVTIGNNVATIGNSAFRECTSLTSVTIQNGVTSIGVGAFEACASLTSVTIPASITSILSVAFSGTNLKGVFFKGNAPSIDSIAFYNSDNVIVYYLPGTTGWGATLAGRPAFLWNPLAQISDASFGVRTNRFGFTITGTTNIPIVVEACTTLANADWVPLQSLNLTNGAFYFSDPQWTTYPARLYRLRSP